MTRSSQRAKGVKLPDKIDELTFGARRRALVEMRAEREARHADKEVKLTFFDILPELRLRVYGYAMQSQQPRLLKDLKAPTLATVSKQVRAECLPVFFSQCTFAITVRTNCGSKSDIDALVARNGLPILQGYAYNGDTSPSGLLRTAAIESGGLQTCTPWLTKLEKREGIVPAFRSIEIRAAVLSHLYTYWDIPVLLGLALRVPVASRSRPIVELDEALIGQAEYAMLKGLAGELQAAAEKMASSRERFIGFTIKEMKELVKVFSYWPEQDT